MKKEVRVEGMKCAGCAETVQERFRAVEGVDSVTVDLANKKVSIESQTNIEKEKLVAALTGTKYLLID